MSSRRRCSRASRRSATSSAANSDATTERTLIADRGDAGRRLDLVIRRHLSDVPAATRTRVQQWIAGRRVTVNGVLVTRVASRVPRDAVVAVTLPVGERAPMAAEARALHVLYEDDALLVIDKAAGEVVHPTYRHTHGTLMNAILWHARHWPAGQRPSIVGRLDKLTSGLVVVAKTTAMHAMLQRTLASRASTKEYLAIVYGRVSPSRGTIALPLAHDPGDRRRVVVSAGGQASETEYERIATVPVRRGGLSVVRCRLLTGRTHQIRVHLAARGWPIVGDPKYGEPRWTAFEDSRIAEACRQLPRQALHACRTAFVHPLTRAGVVVESRVPADMQSLLDLAGFPADAR